MDPQLSGVLPSTLNDTLSVRNEKKILKFFNCSSTTSQGKCSKTHMEHPPCHIGVILRTPTCWGYYAELFERKLGIWQLSYLVDIKSDFIDVVSGAAQPVLERQEIFRVAASWGKTRCSLVVVMYSHTTRWKQQSRSSKVSKGFKGGAV